MNKQSIKVFISYAHKDNDYFDVFKDGLIGHLSTSDQFDFGVWHDLKIHEGSFWDDEIQKSLSECDLAILCVSANFLNSQYIEAKEFGNLINKFPGTLIIPVYFNHCNFKTWDELARKQFFKPEGKKYGKAADIDFSFGDLVELTPKDGRFIPVPNAKRDLYFQDLVSKIEIALTAKTSKTSPLQKIINRQAPRYLNSNNYPYFEKDSFFGREELLKQIDDKLKKLDVPLLLSGIGGMGKTAVAVAYGKDPAFRSNYNNIAWIDVTENIFSNLFSAFKGNLFIPFEYSPDASREKDISYFMELLKNLAGNNLLLIDNANEEKDLQQFINAWKKYQPSCKCLITTRSENHAYKNHLLKLHVISLHAAEQLYKRHNEQGFDKASFNAIYEYIGGHTFLIELLAKFGQESNTINSTKELLAYLKTNGIAALNKNVLAKKGQEQETDKLVGEFVMELYDPLSLNERDREYMRYFSLLPAAETEFATLLTLFGVGENDKESFSDSLNSLAKRGWLIRNKNNRKCHQIIQEICREKLQPCEDNCGILIWALDGLFRNQNTSEVSPFFETGFAVIHNLKTKGHNCAVLQIVFADRIVETGNFNNAMRLLKSASETFHFLEEEFNKTICISRIGGIYVKIGNREDAFKNYQEYNKIAKALSDKNPDNENYRDNLAVSYEKLGNIYLNEGNMIRALECFSEDLNIMKNLSDKNPDNTEFKNGLAISYSKLGDIYNTEKNMIEALHCYTEDLNITEILSDKNPDNIEFKNNLAVSYCKLGDLYNTEGNMTEALKYYTNYNTIEKALSDKNPDNIEFKNGLAVSYTKLGSISDNKEKKNYYIKAKKIWEELTAKVPSRVVFKKNLEWVNDQLKNL